jgi:hypothetical protein
MNRAIAHMKMCLPEQINNEDCFYDVIRAIRATERPARPAPAPASMGYQKPEKKKRGLCTIL